jgi:hypothetical protein
MDRGLARKAIITVSAAESVIIAPPETSESVINAPESVTMPDSKPESVIIRRRGRPVTATGSAAEKARARAARYRARKKVAPKEPGP